MKITKNKYIIMLKDKKSYERFLDVTGYLSQDVEDAITSNSLTGAKDTLNTLDEPALFEIKAVKITYEF